MSEMVSLNGYALADAKARKELALLSETVSVFKNISESDEGKFLRIVDGKIKWETINSAEETKF